jgi:hypothetical protein
MDRRRRSPVLITRVLAGKLPDCAVLSLNRPFKRPFKNGRK